MEDLSALFLKEIKREIFNRWGIGVRNAAVGRPVKFSSVKRDGALACDRLQKGFRLAELSGGDHFDEVMMLERVCPFL